MRPRLSSQLSATSALLVRSILLLQYAAAATSSRSSSSSSSSTGGAEGSSGTACPQPMDAVPAPAAAGDDAADAADAQLIAGGGQYVWLPRPAAVPEGRTPFAAMDPATAAGQQEGGGATAAAAAAAAALPLRLRAPPAVGSRIGGVFFPTTATPELHSSGSVIVVGEWWGIDSHVLQLARHLAAAGFDVLCLDVLRDGPRAIPVDVTRGYETAEGLAAAFAESAHKMKTCDWRSALVDVGAAADWLRSRRRQQRLTQAAAAAAEEEAAEAVAVEERRNGVGILGCSFGAVLALLSAAGHETAGDPAVAAMSSGVAPSPPPVEAAVAFYGLPDERFTGGAVRLWEPAWVQAACQLHFPSAAPGLEGFDDAAKGRELLELLEVEEGGGGGGGGGAGAGAGGGKRHELYEYTVHPCETTPTHIRPLLLALHLFLD
jgi:dienelactone hydrolase